MTTADDANWWRRSSFCGASAGCVDVRRDGDVIVVRDSKFGDHSTQQKFSLDRWPKLLAALAQGADHTHILPVDDGVYLGRVMPLYFTAEEWNAFVAGVKAGEFDPERLSSPTSSEGCDAGLDQVGVGGGSNQIAATGAGAIAVPPVPVAAQPEISDETDCPHLADILAGRAKGCHDDSTCGWCAAIRSGTAPPVPVAAQPELMSFAYRDSVVETDLRASTYPYGGGRPGVGVQITLEQVRDGKYPAAVRLPEEHARALSDWIRVAVAAEPDADELDHLAEVITEARARGIFVGSWSLARWIFDAGYRREPRPVDGKETAAASARRYAGELVRLEAGLRERGILPAPDAPVGTAAVDTALMAIDDLLAEPDASSTVPVDVANEWAKAVAPLVPEIAAAVPDREEIERRDRLAESWAEVD